MPKFMIHNPTACKVQIPYTSLFVKPRSNLQLDIQPMLLATDEMQKLIAGGHLRLSPVVETPRIYNGIEIPVVEMLGSGGGGGGGLDDVRVGVALIGALDGVNTIFTAPETFVQDPPDLSIAVYLNGQRLVLTDDYTVSGGGPGQGTTVTLLVAPQPWEKVRADYVAA